jgi:8-oxo-dGTP pyrophosphatase MutT (NUDIX family)
MSDLQPASWVPDENGAHDETLVQTWLFRLRRERFRSVRSGKTHDYFVTELADGVHVIAVTTDDRVVLVSQFRAGSRCDSLETPGGLLESGEDPCEAGARELLEETGYAGDPPVSLGLLRPNPALLTMAITTVVIRNVRRVAEPQPDDGEELAVVMAPASQIPAMIRDGRIDHAACVAGLLMWLATRDQGAGSSSGDPLGTAGT